MMIVDYKPYNSINPVRKTTAYKMYYNIINSSNKAIIVENGLTLNIIFLITFKGCFKVFL